MVAANRNHRTGRINGWNRPHRNDSFSASSTRHLMPHVGKCRQNLFWLFIRCPIDRKSRASSSLLPYVRSGREPSEEVLRLKMIEIACTLLDTDKRYVPTLFDLNGTCRLKLLDLLKKSRICGSFGESCRMSLTTKSIEPANKVGSSDTLYFCNVNNNSDNAL